MGFRAELRRAVRETSPYLLSHHVPARHCRCYRLTVGDRDVHLCARCSGVYPGILAGLVGFVLGMRPGLAAVALFPLPALLDWTLTSLLDYRGANVVRTATGGLLGTGYGFGLGYLFLGGDGGVVGIGVAYAVLAFALVALERHRNGA